MALEKWYIYYSYSSYTCDTAHICTTRGCSYLNNLSWLHSSSTRYVLGSEQKHCGRITPLGVVRSVLTYLVSSTFAHHEYVTGATPIAAPQLIKPCANEYDVR